MVVLAGVTVLSLILVVRMKVRLVLMEANSVTARKPTAMSTIKATLTVKVKTASSLQTVIMKVKLVRMKQKVAGIPQWLRMFTGQMRTVCTSLRAPQATNRPVHQARDRRGNILLGKS